MEGKAAIDTVRPQIVILLHVSIGVVDSSVLFLVASTVAEALTPGIQYPCMQERE